MNHAQEVAAVRASEQLAPTSSERHGGPYPLRTTLFPGTLRMATAPVVEQSRVHAPRPAQAGHDGRVEGSSPCTRCDNGTWTDANGARWKCFYCGGVPVPRQIPGSRRAA